LGLYASAGKLGDPAAPKVLFQNEIAAMLISQQAIDPNDPLHEER
jgi:hypothetical protein